MGNSVTSSYWSLGFGHWSFPRLLSPRGGWLNAHHQFIACFQLAGGHFSEVAVGNSGFDRHGAELIAVLHPDVPLAPLAARDGPLVRGQAGLGRLLLFLLRI